MTLQLSGRAVVVIGGSTRAEATIAGLLDAGAHVTVCATDPTTVICAMAESGRVGLVDELTPALIARAALVTVCDPALLTEAGALAAAAGVVLDDATGAAPAPTSRAGELAGTVALVGGGPGDPGLITVAGRDLLARADVVVADHLGPLSLLADLADDVEIIDAAKLPYGRAMAQRRINELLIDRARAGKFVVRLKGGDPYLFGRGFEEWLALEDAGIPVTEVPGITSAIAVPAAAGIPVTHRGMTHDVTVVSGHLPPGHETSLVNWAAMAGMRGTLVVIMGVRNGPAIAAALIDGGRDPQTPAAIVQEGTTDRQRCARCTLGTLADTLAAEDIKPPAVLVIGDVVSLRP